MSDNKENDNKRVLNDMADSLDKIAKSLWTIRAIVLITFFISLFFLVVAYATVPR